MRKIISVILVACWMVLIFNFSSMPGGESNSLSMRIVDFSVNIFGQERASMIDVETLNIIIRKMAHFSLYAILAGLILNMVRSFGWRISWKVRGIVVGCCFLYACTDEFHQLFTGRTGAFTDVLIDTLGAFVMVFAIYLFGVVWRRIRGSGLWVFNRGGT